MSKKSSEARENMEYSRKSSEAGAHRGRGRGSETRPDQVGPGGLAKDLDLYLKSNGMPAE